MNRLESEEFIMETPEGTKVARQVTSEEFDRVLAIKKVYTNGKIVISDAQGTSSRSQQASKNK